MDRFVPQTRPRDLDPWLEVDRGFVAGEILVFALPRTNPEAACSGCGKKATVLFGALVKCQCGPTTEIPR